MEPVNVPPRRKAWRGRLGHFAFRSVCGVSAVSLLDITSSDAMALRGAYASRWHRTAGRRPERVPPQASTWTLSAIGFASTSIARRAIHVSATAFSTAAKSAALAAPGAPCCVASQIPTVAVRAAVAAAP